MTDLTPEDARLTKRPKSGYISIEEAASVRADMERVGEGNGWTPDEYAAWVIRLLDQLAAPCGSCHPCTEWANQTWVNAGRSLPHLHEYDALLAERDELARQLAITVAQLGRVEDLYVAWFTRTDAFLDTHKQHASELRDALDGRYTRDGGNHA